MTLEEFKLRYGLVKTMQALDSYGLNHGTAGNASVRCGDSVLVTPTGIPANKLRPWNMVKIDSEGGFEGRYRPTSEWQMHFDLLTKRRDVSAVVHCHSRFATTLACAGKDIPSLHYMTAVSGGPTIPLAPYETYGSPELAAAIIDTLDGQRACLMANHGQIAIGRNLREAFGIASEVEIQASYYFGTLAIGGAVTLTDAQMGEVIKKFQTYGQKRSKKP